jgi:anaerobic ribonucleoside-triphosphate reductase activating protein
MALLNVAMSIECTEVEGPGKRYALWVQGCLLRCVDCCNPEMLTITPRRIVDATVVADEILVARVRHEIEGVTFLGGEPMLQAKGLAVVARCCRDEGLSVMTFTGYTLEELRARSLPGSEELLTFTDILVDGPYLPERRETERNWVGSRNQRFHYLSRRHDASIEQDPRYKRGVEVRVGSDGGVTLNGWPARGSDEKKRFA